MVMTRTMSEHSPAPVAARGVYGFALYLACTTAFVVYVAWSVLPDSVLHSIGITYYPQKYWVIALPVYFLMALALFAFFIYPALNQRLAPSLDSLSSYTDSHSLRPSDNNEENDDNSEAGYNRRIPPAYDLDISEVSKRLYLMK